MADSVTLKTLLDVLGLEGEERERAINDLAERMTTTDIAEIVGPFRILDVLLDVLEMKDNGNPILEEGADGNVAVVGLLAAAASDVDRIALLMQEILKDIHVTDPNMAEEAIRLTKCLTGDSEEEESQEDEEEPAANAGDNSEEGKPEEEGDTTEEVEEDNLPSQNDVDDALSNILGWLQEDANPEKDKGEEEAEEGATTGSA